MTRSCLLINEEAVAVTIRRRLSLHYVISFQRLLKDLEDTNNNECNRKDSEKKYHVE